jgi:hypothetical protein
MVANHYPGKQIHTCFGGLQDAGTLVVGAFLPFTFFKISLELRAELTQVVPQACPIAKLSGTESLREAAGQLSHCLKMVNEAVPLSSVVR